MSSWLYASTSMAYHAEKFFRATALTTFGSSRTTFTTNAPLFLQTDLYSILGFEVPLFNFTLLTFRAPQCN